MGTILVIDDDVEICGTMESLVGRLSHGCISAHSLATGREILKSNDFDVVFLDVRLPDGNGLDLLMELSERENIPEVIILTGRGDPEGAELAIQSGAWDYILKPSSVGEITQTLDRALRYRQEKLGKSEIREHIASNIIGTSTGIKTACRQMFQAAASESNLLITGETGTGKEVFARTIHEHSSRKAGNFVVVDCAVLTESLIEATLFGHRKGSFTGAHDHQLGLVKLADGGTLFLDEIGELPQSVQKSFLRVLQERSFRAIGDPKEQTSDFRLIAATNRGLELLVERGDFRGDLLYRIKTIMIRLPALRQRSGDIKLLTQYKVEQLMSQYSHQPKDIGADFFETLEKYSWPGNVRELFNIIERAFVTSGSEKKLFAMHLPRSLRIQVAKEQIKKMTTLAALDHTVSFNPEDDVLKTGQDILDSIVDQGLPSIKDFKTAAEKRYLCELIRLEHGDIVAILNRSGLSRSHFYSLLKKYSLSIDM